MHGNPTPALLSCVYIYIYAHITATAIAEMWRARKYIHIYIYVYVYIYMRVCIYSIFSYLGAGIPPKSRQVLCQCVYRCMFIHVCMYTFTDSCVYTYMCIDLHRFMLIHVGILNTRHKILDTMYFLILCMGFSFLKLVHTYRSCQVVCLWVYY